MPKPISMTGNTAAGRGGRPAKTSKNPFIAWIQKRKDAREEAKAEADRRITERKARNEEQISKKLRSISFISSALPPEVLSEKQFQEQQVGDIQFQIMGAIQRIEDNTQDYNGLNIQKIDNGIYQIAVLAKQAIDAGNAHSARAACHALSVTIGEIRDKIPSVPVNLQKAFIDSAEQYISVWIDYISNCTVLDGLQANAKTREEAIQKMQEELKTAKEALAARLRSDAALAKQMKTIENQTYATHGSTWSPEVREVYQKMLDFRFKESSLKFEVLCHNIDYQNMLSKQRMLDGFLTKLRTIPQPEDPDLLNKFKALIDDTLTEAAEQDKKFQEMFEEMDRMDAAIEQLAYAEGNIRAKETAANKLNEIVELAKKQQMEEFGIEEEQEEDSGIRLYTMEELTRMKQEREAEKARQAQQAQQVNVNVTQQKQVNTNRPRNTN